MHPPRMVTYGIWVYYISLVSRSTVRVTVIQSHTKKIYSFARTLLHIAGLLKEVHPITRFSYKSSQSKPSPGLICTTISKGSFSFSQSRTSNANIIRKWQKCFPTNLKRHIHFPIKMDLYKNSKFLLPLKTIKWKKKGIFLNIKIASSCESGLIFSSIEAPELIYKYFLNGIYTLEPNLYIYFPPLLSFSPLPLLSTTPSAAESTEIFQNALNYAY